MSGRIHVIFVMALLVCVPFSSSAPADIGAFLSDVAGMKAEDTTQFVTELIETATDSQPESSTDASAVELVDAVTVESAEPTTEIDLEAVIIDLGVDRLAHKDPLIDLKIEEAPALGAKDEIQTTTDVAQGDEISTEIVAHSDDAPHDPFPVIQEKIETTAGSDDHQTTLSEEAPSTEAATSQPEADVILKIDSKNQTKEANPMAILADPEDVAIETTTLTEEKVDIMAHSDDWPTTETVASLEEASTTETGTGRPEADSESGVILKADFKNPTEERNDGTEVVTEGATVHPEFDVAEHTESVPVALKNVAQSTGSTDAQDDAIDSTSVPLADELATLSVNEDVTESAFQSTDSGTDGVDTSSDDVADEIVRMEPQLVKIFDPSVDVEATTFLAEANLQTDAEGDATTESFYHADGVDDEMEADEEALTTTGESVTVTLEIGTESGTELATESGPELTSQSDTTALPVEVAKLSTPGGPAASAAIGSKRSYKGYKVYRVILPTEDSVRRILSMEDEPGVEFWADPRLLLRPRGLFVTSAADVMVAPQIVAQIESVFRQARLTYTVLIDDVHMSIAKENPVGPSFARSQTGSSGQHRLTWDRYHRLSDINSYLEYLKEAHADWIEVMPIGKSSQGRPIHVIKLSRRRQPDRVETSQKKAILVDAGMHANEWITPAALTWMINELVENADSYSCILDRFDWYFIPMVNPDGYEYSHVVDRMWRKTRRNYTSTLVRTSARKLRVDADDEQCLGADINRNFEFHWRKGGSSSNVCSPSFAGVKPFSEPESRALANFMLKQRSRLAMYISLHSYSQMWLLPWGFAEARPEDFSELYSLAKIGARALQRTHNTSYLIGSVPDLLALASGTSQDWAKGVAGVRYSYTLEMRDAGVRGMILPAQQIVPTAEETWAGIYAASVELAHRLYQHLPSCSPF
uniref:Carboxypeptidase B n=1 Tax=Daphnia magna TaxID=35525 RepID=A0A0P5P3C1_9CRUS